MKIVMPENIGNIDTKKLSDFIQDSAVVQIVDTTKDISDDAHFLSVFIMPDMSKITASEQAEALLEIIFQTIVKKDRELELRKILIDQFDWVNSQGIDSEERLEIIKHANEVVSNLHEKYADELRQEHNGMTITEILTKNGLGIRMQQINGIAGMDIRGREVLAK